MKAENSGNHHQKCALEESLLRCPRLFTNIMNVFPIGFEIFLLTKGRCFFLTSVSNFLRAAEVPDASHCVRYANVSDYSCDVYENSQNDRFFKPQNHYEDWYVKKYEFQWMYLMH